MTAASEKSQATKSNKRSFPIGLAYIFPWIIGFSVFQLYPLCMSLYYSFTNYNITQKPRFIGLSNYLNIFTRDDLFWQSLGVTLKYVLIAVPGKLMVALFIAMLLNARIKCINFFRTMYYLPSILGGSVVISLLWRFLFLRDGLINQLFKTMGLPWVDWLGDPSIALFTISFQTIWQFGSSMVLFLAGLKQIPSELYESANVDGASKLRIFIKITLPLLSPIIFFNLVMQTINAFQEFTTAFVITKGGPVRATYLYGMKLYNDAFVFFKMGYASALSWILFAIIIVFTVMIFKTSDYWTYYDDGGRVN
ncbi:MAG: sugar ABC transporter permease [Oscillospiraceae bacterium]|nr:sugar ABC transporter permease [Oscillospiraceae bacterium]